MGDVREVVLAYWQTHPTAGLCLVGLGIAFYLWTAYATRGV